ncbi:MAG: hypothetical protein NWE89_04775 [Candidatus Bathyarchaeota archaeon]|nr:hypothetical protein [Candidatus Bathyarchaeota archaeon]
MSHTETVTGKIPAEYKELLQEHGVNISKLIREAVEKEIERIREEEQRKALKAASQVLQKIPDQEIIDIIRKGRDRR